MNFAKSLTDTAALIDAVLHIRLNVVKFFMFWLMTITIFTKWKNKDVTDTFIITESENESDKGDQNFQSTN